MKGTLHRSSLWLALGLALAAPVAFAANTDGALVGHVAPGTEVTIRNPETGFERTVTADAQGNYRFTFLPVGTYTVQVMQGGQPVGAAKTVYVSLGNATTLDLTGGTLETVEVIGSSVLPIDTTSTESATNVTAEELQRLPVPRSVTDVALLAPGTVQGEFGGISFGGSSVAENAVYINGLNVTDFYNRVGFSSVPFKFFKEFQVKTGGYSVEFGRTTGGVLNAVTKSGTNEFHYGAELVYQPSWLQSEQEDNPGRVARYDQFDDTSLNLYASGALIKDHLFFYAMYEGRSNQGENSDNEYENFFEDDTGSGFWGAKLDWQINDSHLLEFLAFSDSDKLTTDVFEVDQVAGGTRTYANTIFDETGGDNWSLSYTGFLTDNFSMKALYGENERSASTSSLQDQNCALVQDRRVGSSFLGCTTNTAVVAREDTRKAYRLDFEWGLGDHLLRFGLDHEKNTSFYDQRYPGPGFRYEVFNVGGSGIVNGTPVPPGTTAYVRTREVRNNGTFETEQQAYYLEDNWQINDYLLINAGVRVESFDNMDGQGASYIKIDNQIAPRLGFSLDPKGDGTMKIFGNIGRYFLPVANVINIKQAGPFLDRRTFYVFNGFDANNTPILGPQIGPVDDEQGDGTVPDITGEVDADMDQVFQDELILGFQQQITNNWTWGVRGIFRKLTNAIDDMHITNNGFCDTDFFAMANPGLPLTVFGDTDCDGTNDSWITIDTANQGWRRYDSDDNTLGYNGWHKPRREYKALEFQLDRAWDEKWLFNASYTLAFSEGNAEGPVNSDTDFADSGRTEAFDTPWVNYYGTGWLPNDRRHQIKLRGVYAITDNWHVGSTINARSGRPVSAFGAANPFDNEEFHSLFVCVANCDEPNSTDRTYQFIQRGSYDRLPWTYELGLNLTYLKSFGSADLRVALDLFNVTNEQRVNEVDDQLELEDQIGTFNEFFLRGTDFQSARYGQITISLDF